MDGAAINDTPGGVSICRCHCFEAADQFPKLVADGVLDRMSLLDRGWFEPIRQAAQRLHVTACLDEDVSRAHDLLVVHGTCFPLLGDMPEPATAGRFCHRSGVRNASVSMQDGMLL